MNGSFDLLQMTLASRSMAKTQHVGTPYSGSAVGDLGDWWRHDITVEKILPIEKGTHYPVCLDGNRACPPEDCGGTSGYEELLEALGDPSHDEHEAMFLWLREDFDSEKFDIKSVNKKLGGS